MSTREVIWPIPPLNNDRICAYSSSDSLESEMARGGGFF